MTAGGDDHELLAKILMDQVPAPRRGIVDPVVATRSGAILKTTRTSPFLVARALVDARYCRRAAEGPCGD
jgi:hypothetical protein